MYNSNTDTTVEEDMDYHWDLDDEDDKGERTVTLYMNQGTSTWYIAFTKVQLLEALNQYPKEKE